MYPPVPASDQQVGLPSDLDLGLMARIHFNTQTSDFGRSRSFYRMLGFTRGVSGFPKTNTHLMARSLGMYDLCTYSGTGDDETGIISLVDPDGIYLELVGPIGRRERVDPPEWCQTE